MCNRCGSWGHKASVCPWKDVGQHCWGFGHGLAQCPIKDAEMKGKGQVKGWYGKGCETGQDGKGKGWGKGKDKLGKG